MIVGIAGPARSGKSTFANILYAHCQKFDLNVRVASFADPLKMMCAELFALTPEQLWGAHKDDVDLRYGWAPRHALQQMGDTIKVLYPRFFVDGPRSPFHLGAKCEVVVLPDVRFTAEVEATHDRDGRIVLITGRRQPVTGGEHHTEWGIAPELADHHIDNSGTLEEFIARCYRLGSQLVADCLRQKAGK